jgi:hypothetical protein
VAEATQPEPTQSPEANARVSEQPDVVTEEDDATEPANDARDSVPQQDPPPAEPQRRQSVFVPMLLGGVVAAALGYGAAYFGLPRTDPALPANLSQMQTQIAGIEDKIAALPAPPDLSPIEESVASVQSQTASQIDTVAAALNDLANRLDALEKAPNADGTLSSTALAAYEREIEQLRAEMMDQTAKMQQMVADAAAELESTRASAATIEADAANAAKASVARAALARLQAAVDLGQPFAAALAEFSEASGIAAPAGLTDIAADGPATLTVLQDTFPDVARAALAAARREGVSGEGSGGFGAFLRSQLDIRSTTPKEGNSVDAILSRAEAALRQGRLSDALAEVNSLPELARAEMTDWTAQATGRAEALAAVESLASSLTSN